MELPPRARRILGVKNPLIVFSGTTSACAENTRGTRNWWCEDWNYLRVRGEYRVRRQINPHQKELPPRARRIPIGEDVGFHAQGTTSACAENTQF